MNSKIHIHEFLGGFDYDNNVEANGEFVRLDELIEWLETGFLEDEPRKGENPMYDGSRFALKSIINHLKRDA